MRKWSDDEFTKFKTSMELCKQALKSTPEREGKLLHLPIKKIEKKVDPDTQRIIDTIKVRSICCIKSYMPDNPHLLHVIIQVDNEYFKSLKKRNKLGTLYGVDLGNLLSRVYGFNQYVAPVVDDKKRASKGIKTITVKYYFDNKALYDKMSS